MFNLSQNNSVIYELNMITEQKYLIIKDNQNNNQIDVTKTLKLLKTELELMGFLNKEYNEQSRYIFSELIKHLNSVPENNLDEATKMQKKLLMQFIENDLKLMIQECVSIKKLLDLQIECIKINDIEKYKSFLNQEKQIFDKLIATLQKDGELESKLSQAYSSAKHIDYNELMAKIKKKLSGFLTKGYKILPPIGIGNIPLSGPVIIAPRHYEAGIDSAALFAAIPRRTFIMVGVDWVQTGVQNFASKFMYSGIGAIKVNRQSRPDSDVKIEASKFYNQGATAREALKQVSFLLKSREAIIIFPEGWANEGRTQGTIIKENGVLPAQEGFLVSVELAQRELSEKISIVPAGLVFDHEKKTVQAIFGKSMFYQTNIKDKNYRKAFGESLMSEIKKLSGL